MRLQEAIGPRGFSRCPRQRILAPAPCPDRMIQETSPFAWYRGEVGPRDDGHRLRENGRI